MARVRSTQEMLDSVLVLVGWRVYVQTGSVRMYATGAGTWTLLKDRAFLFTDAPNSARKGNDDGRRWAFAHARHLVNEHTKKQWPSEKDDPDYEYDVLKPKVVCVRRRIFPKTPRSATWPTNSDPKDGGTER